MNVRMETSKVDSMVQCEMVLATIRQTSEPRGDGPSDMAHDVSFRCFKSSSDSLCVLWFSIKFTISAVCATIPFLKFARFCISCSKDCLSTNSCEQLLRKNRVINRTRPFRYDWYSRSFRLVCWNVLTGEIKSEIRVLCSDMIGGAVFRWRCA
jgi:hypothetical protein